MGGRWTGRRGRQGVVWALVLAGAVGGAAPALAATPTGADRSAAVQAMLDRVLGPGNSVVEIAATVQAGDGSTTAVTWGAAVPGSVTASRTRTAAGTVASVTRLNDVGSTTTAVVTPAGSLVRQTVAVAVDRAAARGIPTGRLRRLIAAAAGLTPGRGDRLSILRTPLAHPVAAGAPRSVWTDALLPLAVPAIEVGGGVVALLVLVLVVRGRPRGARPGLGRS